MQIQQLKQSTPKRVGSYYPYAWYAEHTQVYPTGRNSARFSGPTAILSSRQKLRRGEEVDLRDAQLAVTKVTTWLLPIQGDQERGILLCSSMLNSTACLSFHTVMSSWRWRV
jgi:hypothetical protein